MLIDHPLNQLVLLAARNTVLKANIDKTTLPLVININYPLKKVIDGFKGMTDEFINPYL